MSIRHREGKGPFRAIAPFRVIVGLVAFIYDLVLDNVSHARSAAVLTTRLFLFKSGGICVIWNRSERKVSIHSLRPFLITERPEGQVR